MNKVRIRTRTRATGIDPITEVVFVNVDPGEYEIIERESSPDGAVKGRLRSEIGSISAPLIVFQPTAGPTPLGEELSGEDRS